MAIQGPWTHEQAVVRDVRLHYVTAGDEGDPLVVLLHGFPEFWYSWRHQIAALAESGFRVVAPDMRGYNASEKPHGVASYRMEKLVGDVVGLIEHCNRERHRDREQAHVVGHDWGGLVGWATAIRRPDVVEKLAVLNAPHLDRYRRELLRNPGQLSRSLYVLYFQLPWLPELTLGVRDCAGGAEMLRETSGPGTFDETDLRRYREAACRPGALTAMLNYYRAGFREEFRRFVGVLINGERPANVVRVPTLLLWGEQDHALDVELTEGVEQWVPDLRVERLPEATHWVQNDAPEEVSASLTTFLEQ
jgi:pimeloyl-ACP methyl ester carboxylesterase